MPKGVYTHKPGQGFLNAPHTYTVTIGGNKYHEGTNRREALHAFRRASRPCKGESAPAKGELLSMKCDGEELFIIFV